ncbi:MAG: hypothetical protein ACYDC6_01590 [Acidobacteriaceae bacterium]
MRQAEVYRRYVGLQSIAAQRFAGSLAARLVVSADFGATGAELALATTMAGGAFLGIEPDALLLKNAVRNGSCDFMVNTLDESLRVLKNELRKHKPVSVGLLGNPHEVLAIMADRGVQPDLVTSNTGTAPFLERGAGLAASETKQEADEVEVTWTARNLQDLLRIDRIAMDVLPPEDTLRRRWLQQAAGSFHRQRPLQRVLGMQRQELDGLLDLLSRAKENGDLATPASICWSGPNGELNNTDL